MNTWISSLSVRPAQVAEFVAASVEVAGATVCEAGLVSFAVLQQTDDPCRFSIFEAYHDEQAHAAHLTAAHHRKWQQTIGPLLDRPLVPRPYRPIFPAAEGWEHHLEA